MQAARSEDEVQRYLQAQQLMSDAINQHLGFRGYGLMMRLQKTANVRDLHDLLPDFAKALVKRIGMAPATPIVESHRAADHAAVTSAAPARPLAGLRVLELGALIAGPFCAKILAEFGADVVKVEPPGLGDPLRRWRYLENDTSLWWHVQSRDKRSITVDLRKPAGQAIARALALCAPTSWSRISAPARSKAGAWATTRSPRTIRGS